MTFKSTKELILLRVSDLVSDFTFYDRKGDEDLDVDTLNTAFEAGIITVKEVVDYFEKELKEVYPDK